MASGPRFRPPRAVPLINGIPREAQEQLQAWLLSVFGQLAEDLATVQVDAAPTIIESARIDVSAGTQRRVSPSTDGMVAALEAPSAANSGRTITLIIEKPAGELKVVASPHIGPDGKVTQTLINDAAQATYSLPGVVQFRSNGVDSWKTFAESPAETVATSSTAALTASLDATYLLRSAHPSLANARSVALEDFFGLSIGPNYDTPGFVSWEPGEQAAGTWWAQLLDIADSPRAYDIADSLGDGLAYEAAVTNANAPFPFTVTEYDDAAAAAATSHVITMPPATTRLPGDRIIVEMRVTGTLFGVSAVDISALPDWAYMDGESTAVDGVGSVDVIELILDSTASNDPGDTITISLGATSAALTAHVWHIRDSHPTLAGQCRAGFSATSSASRDVGILLSPWREANNLWGVFVGNNNNLATISTFPTGFTTGQGQLSVAISSHTHTIGYGSQQLRAGSLDADAWAFAASPRSVAIHWVVAPRATGQIALATSAAVPAETFVSNLFDEAKEARANDLNDFAGVALKIVSEVANGPFPEPLDLDGSNTLIDAIGLTHNIVMPAFEAGQAALIVISVGGTADVSSVSDVGATPRNWQFLGAGVGSSHRCEVWYITPSDMTEACAAKTEPVVVTIAAAPNAVITRIVAINDAHPTQLPTLSAFSIQNGTTLTTTNDVGSVTPVPGDGSLEANYLYLLFLSTATEDSIVSAYPTNYVDTDGVAGGDQVFVASGTATIDNSLAYCQRQVRGSSEDAGAFTYAASGNGRSIAVNVAIIPAPYARMDVDVPLLASLLPAGRQGKQGDPGQRGRVGTQGPPGLTVVGPRGGRAPEAERGQRGVPGTPGMAGAPGARGPRGRDADSEYVPARRGISDSELTWANVLRRGNSSGAFSPTIISTQSLVFSSPSAGGGQITSSLPTFSLDVDGSLTLHGETTAVVSADTSASLSCSVAGGANVQVLPSGVTLIAAAAGAAGFLRMLEDGASTPSNSAGQGLFWWLNVAPNHPMFTDDVNADWRYGYAAVAVSSTLGSVTAATTALSLTTSFTIPAGTSRVGTKYRGTALVHFARGATATALNVRLSANVAGVEQETTGNIPATTTSGQSGVISVECVLTVLSLGVGGTAYVSIAGFENIRTGLPFNPVYTNNVTAFAFDSTIANTFEIAAAMSAAVASTVLTNQGGSIERLI